MFAALLSRLSRIRVTLGYTAALVTVAAALVAVDPHTRHRIVHDASTNLHNLGAGRLGTLFDSAFITDAAPIAVWLPGLVCLLALAELCWHGGRLILTFITGHLVATLLVAAGLAVAVHRGWLPMSVTRASDVGMSYGAMAVFGALAPAVAPRWRPAWLGWWLPVVAVAALLGGEFTDVGHATAVILGMLMGIRLPRPDRWTTTRLALLAVAAVFAFVVLAHSATTVAAAAGLGTVGAMLGSRVGRPRAASPPLRG
ncbi:rhomboid-like protein [Mycolicibacillus trivialis]